MSTSPPIRGPVISLTIPPRKRAASSRLCGSPMTLDRDRPADRLAVGDELIAGAAEPGRGDHPDRAVDLDHLGAGIAQLLHRARAGRRRRPSAADRRSASGCRGPDAGSGAGQDRVDLQPLLRLLPGQLGPFAPDSSSALVRSSSPISSSNRSDSFDSPSSSWIRSSRRALRYASSAELARICITAPSPTRNNITAAITCALPGRHHRPAEAGPAAATRGGGVAASLCGSASLTGRVPGHSAVLGRSVLVLGHGALVLRHGAGPVGSRPRW